MIVIKKYSNRRLYDTSSSAYVNLHQIADKIREGHRIKVVDAKEGDDLTQQILLQILLEIQGTQELLPNGLLHRMIRTTNENPMQKLVLSQLATGLQLLEQQLAAFDAQAGWTRQEPAPPYPGDRTAKPERPGPKKAKAPPPAEEEPPTKDDELDDLRARLAALEKRLSD
jgi:polyhydroxyalkanoate synthesis repressor PhaR